jgi:hypothetical protein
VVISMKDPDVNDASAESVYGACEDLHSFNFHIIYGSGCEGAYEYAELLFFLPFSVEAVNFLYRFRFFPR